MASADTGSTGWSRCCEPASDDRDVLPAEQTIDVRFDEFMADDMGMVRRIYDVAGQPMTDEAQRGDDRASWPNIPGVATAA